LTKGDTAGAIHYFEVASLSDPKSVVAATELGLALFTASKIPEAEKQFRRALKLDPKYTDARYDLASMQAAGGQWEAAASEFREVVAERPDDRKAWQHLVEVLALWGDELAKSGQYEPAASRYREALAYRKGDPGLHMGLGAVLTRLGKLAEAQTEFEEALRLDPNFEQARQALATVRKLTTEGHK
jgi:Flp pilus assembly protein TadD